MTFHSVSKQIIGNNRGNLIIGILLFSSISLIVGGAMINQSVHLNQVEKNILVNKTKARLKKEVATIFSAPSLCLAMFRVVGDDFVLGQYFVPGRQIGVGLVLEEMKIANRSVVDGLTRADAIISFSSNNEWSKEHSISVPIRFNAIGGGRVDKCKLEISREVACVTLGAIWNKDEARCEICEQLGGQWESDKCVI